jgi:hypothetical protein
MMVMSRTPAHQLPLHRPGCRQRLPLQLRRHLPQLQRQLPGLVATCQGS